MLYTLVQNNTDNKVFICFECETRRWQHLWS